MKPYGIRNKVRRTVAKHQHCGICHPPSVIKGRERAISRKVKHNHGTNSEER